jgi:hypothetical protein
MRCGHEFRGTRNQEWLRWRVPAAIAENRSLVREGAQRHETRNCLTVISDIL